LKRSPSDLSHLDLSPRDIPSRGPVSAVLRSAELQVLQHFFVEAICHKAYLPSARTLRHEVAHRHWRVVIALILFFTKCNLARRRQLKLKAQMSSTSRRSDKSYKLVFVGVFTICALGSAHEE
jgi:hypothetical protein